MIYNYSRHDLNADQLAALEVAFGEVEVSPPLNPFFVSAEDVKKKLDGKTSVAVIPGALLLEVMTGDGFRAGTTIVVFRADQSARKRGRFAAIGMQVFQWQEINLPMTWGEPFAVEGGCSVVKPVLIHKSEITPTVEQDFRTGELFPYEG